MYRKRAPRPLSEKRVRSWADAIVARRRTHVVRRWNAYWSVPFALMTLVAAYIGLFVIKEEQSRWGPLGAAAFCAVMVALMVRTRHTFTAYVDQGTLMVVQRSLVRTQRSTLPLDALGSMAMSSAGEDSNFMTMKVGRGSAAVTVIAFEASLEALKRFLGEARSDAAAAKKARDP